MSLLNCVPYVPSVPAWPTCPCAKVPNVCQLLIFTCQRANKHANVPQVCQLFSLVCQHAKGEPTFQLRLPKSVPIFQLYFKRIFQFMNFSIMVNICKFQEYLGNCRKPISQIKEFKFWHLQNFIKEKPCQPNAFGVVFNGVRGINRTIISARVKWSWIYFFIYSVCKQAYLEKHIFLKKHSC